MAEDKEIVLVAESCGEGDQHLNHHLRRSQHNSDHSLYQEVVSSSTDESTDADSANLLDSFYKGLDSAFDEFWNRHVTYVIRIAWHSTRDRDDAFAVAQDVGLKICSRASVYDPARGTVGAWLHRLTVSAAIDCYLRTNRQKGREIQESESIELEFKSNVDIEAQFLAKRKNRDWLECLSTLPPRQRNIFCLAVICESDQVTVAQTLMITELEVSSAVKRAALDLKRCLQHKGWLSQEI